MNSLDLSKGVVGLPFEEWPTIILSYEMLMWCSDHPIHSHGVADHPLSHCR
jgi:hypothetical protein